MEAAREALAQHAEGHDRVGFEARVICADGSVRGLEWNTRTMPERRVVYSVGRDTTDRRGPAGADGRLQRAGRRDRRSAAPQDERLLLRRHPGGAEPEGGGLLGLRDRVATLNGTFAVDSLSGGGTVVRATLPLPAD